MARRIRTAKKLAQRIDINYFKGPNPLRRARFFLALLIPVVGGLWLLGLSTRHHKGVYSPGAVSDPHAFMGDECSRCHVAQGKTFFHTAKLGTTDQACLTCHDGPQHQDGIAATGCAECHVEHRGRLVQIAHVRDANCALCHASLEPAVSRFNNHPGFVLPQTDPGTVKLNHKAHLAQSLTCDQCHHTGIADPNACKPQGANCDRPSASLALMVPVTYKDTCEGCHDALNFQTAFGDTAPHDTPEKIDAWFRRTHSADPAKIASAEKQLWENTCTFCHEQIQLSPGPLPKIAPAKITQRWFNNAVFSHDAHRSVDCLTCHASISNSESTQDINLPKVQDCQQCHRPNRVESACFECHVYHDWTKETPTSGKITAKEVAGLEPKAPAGSLPQLKTLSAIRP
ncbi:MAG: hypothetical protein ACRD50_01835 [Candidatus Acidiferrales bacterium]